LWLSDCDGVDVNTLKGLVDDKFSHVMNLPPVSTPGIPDIRTYKSEVFSSPRKQDFGFVNADDIPPLDSVIQEYCDEFYRLVYVGYRKPERLTTKKKSFRLQSMVSEERLKGRVYSIIALEQLVIVFANSAVVPLKIHILSLIHDICENHVDNYETIQGSDYICAILSLLRENHPEVQAMIFKTLEYIVTVRDIIPDRELAVFAGVSSLCVKDLFIDIGSKQFRLSRDLFHFALTTVYSFVNFNSRFKTVMNSSGYFHLLVSYLSSLCYEVGIVDPSFSKFVNLETYSLVINIIGMLVEGDRINLNTFRSLRMHEFLHKLMFYDEFRAMGCKLLKEQPDRDNLMDLLQLLNSEGSFLLKIDICGVVNHLLTSYPHTQGVWRGIGGFEVIISALAILDGAFNDGDDELKWKFLEALLNLLRVAVHRNPANRAYLWLTTRWRSVADVIVISGVMKTIHSKPLAKLLIDFALEHPKGAPVIRSPEAVLIFISVFQGVSLDVLSFAFSTLLTLLKNARGLACNLEKLAEVDVLFHYVKTFGQLFSEFNPSFPLLHTQGYEIVEILASFRTSCVDLKVLIQNVSKPLHQLFFDIMGRSSSSGRFIEMQHLSSGNAGIKIVNFPYVLKASQGCTISVWFNIQNFYGDFMQLFSFNALDTNLFCCGINSRMLLEMRSSIGDDPVEFKSYEFIPDVWYNIIIGKPKGRSRSYLLYINGAQIDTLKIDYFTHVTSSCEFIFGDQNMIISNMIWWLGSSFIAYEPPDLTRAQETFAKGPFYKGSFDYSWAPGKLVFGLSPAHFLDVKHLHSLRLTSESVHLKQILDLASSNDPGVIVTNTLGCDGVIASQGPFGFLFGGSLCVNMVSVSDSLRQIGFVRAFLSFVDSSTTTEEIESSLLFLGYSLQHNVQNIHEMNRLRGFDLLSHILEKKARLLSPFVVDVLFSIAQGKDIQRPAQKGTIKENERTSNVYYNIDFSREVSLFGKTSSVAVVKERKQEVLNESIFVDASVVSSVLLNFRIWKHCSIQMQETVLTCLSRAVSGGPSVSEVLNDEFGLICRPSRRWNCFCLSKIGIVGELLHLAVSQAFSGPSVLHMHRIIGPVLVDGTSLSDLELICSFLYMGVKDDALVREETDLDRKLDVQQFTSGISYTLNSGFLLLNSMEHAPGMIQFSIQLFESLCDLVRNARSPEDTVNEISSNDVQSVCNTEWVSTFLSPNVPLEVSSSAIKLLNVMQTEFSVVSKLLEQLGAVSLVSQDGVASKRDDLYALLKKKRLDLNILRKNQAVISWEIAANFATKRRQRENYMIEESKRYWEILKRNYIRETSIHLKATDYTDYTAGVRWKVDFTENSYSQRCKLIHCDDFYSVYNIDIHALRRFEDNAPKKQKNVMNRAHRLFEQSLNPKNVVSEHTFHSEVELPNIELRAFSEESKGGASDIDAPSGSIQRMMSEDVEPSGDIDNQELNNSPQEEKSEYSVEMPENERRIGLLDVEEENINDDGLLVVDNDDELVEIDDGAPLSVQQLREDELIMRSLEPDDEILPKNSIFNCSRISGLDLRPAIIVLCTNNMYLIDNFRVTDDGVIEEIKEFKKPWRFRSNVEPCQDPTLGSSSYMISVTARADEKGGDEIYDGRHHESHQLSYLSLVRIYKRKYQFQNVAVEMFFESGFNSLMVFQDRRFRDLFYSIIQKMNLSRRPDDSIRKNHSFILKQRETAERKQMTALWQSGEISTFSYLMYLNRLAGRSYNDLSQYPVFPWILSDYTSESLNLEDPSVFRDLSKPMGALSEKRAQRFIEYYTEWCDPTAPPCHYATHYSTSAAVLGYLCRLEPFSRIVCEFQGGHFDHADRLFRDVNRSWRSSSAEGGTQDVKELIPEFFCLSNFLVNSNMFQLGRLQQSNELVHDIILPTWAKNDPNRFIRLHRMALESDYVSNNIHQWIDLIFGHKQRGKAAVEAQNVFSHFTYDGAVDISKIEDPMEKLVLLQKIENFGQTPRQLFNNSHPARRLPESRVSIFNSCQLIESRLIRRIEEPIGALWFKDEIHAVGHRTIFYPTKLTRLVQWGFSDFGIRFMGMSSSYSRSSLKMKIVHESLHEEQITCVVMSEDARYLFTSGCDSVINVWSLKTDKYRHLTLERRFVSHLRPVTLLAASSDHRILVSTGLDRQVIVWDLNRLIFIRRLPIHPYDVSALKINPRTGDIATCSGPYISVWTINGECLVRFNTEFGNFSAITFTFEPEYICFHNMIITGHRDGSIHFWNINPQASNESKENTTEIDESDFDFPEEFDPSEFFRQKPGMSLSLVHQTKVPSSVEITCLYTTASSWKTFWTGDLNGEIYQWDLKTRR